MDIINLLTNKYIIKSNAIFNKIMNNNNNNNSDELDDYDKVFGISESFKMIDKSYYSQDQLNTLNIPLRRSPGHVFISHVIYRGILSGSVIGAAISPLYHYYKKSKMPMGSYLRSSLPLITGRGLIIGGLLGCGAGLWKLSGYTKHDIYDRAYRLHNNSKQNTLDRYIYKGMFIGGNCGVLLSIMPGLVRRKFSVISGGMGLGVLIATAVYPLFSELHQLDDEIHSKK